MSRKANAVRIGAFILGGVVLIALAVAILGSGFLFEERRAYVAFFEGSLEGLSAGSPVTFRGVRIGEVTSIQLEMDVENFSARIPVYYYIDRNKVTFLGGKSANVTIQELIHRGLRAQLVTQSLITGQQAVELDFRPDVPIIFVGKRDRIDVPEVPVMPSELETVKKRLAGLPVEALAQATLKMVNDIDALVASPETHSLLTSLAGASTEIEHATHDDVGPALKSLLTLLNETTTTVVAARSSLETLKGNINGTAQELRGTDAAATHELQVDGPALRALLEHADQTVLQAKSSFAAVSSVIGPDRPARADFDQLMRELTLTSRALHDLAEELKRNPNSLITGRK